MKAMAMIGTIVLVTTAFGAPVADHVKTDVRGVPLAAKDANHVLVVNVGGAVDEVVFREAATYALSKLAINAWTNSLASFDVEGLPREPRLVQMAFGEKAKVGVFLVKAGVAPRFMAVPGSWCRVNVDGLAVGNPDAQTFKDRVAKMVLKGLAYAAGSGASLDARCSMFFGGATLEGLDGVGIRLSPGVYFPMLETLKRVGGFEIVTRQE